jgi:hypothetical protein
VEEILCQTFHVLSFKWERCSTLARILYSTCSEVEALLGVEGRELMPVAAKWPLCRSEAVPSGATVTKELIILIKTPA